jgi:GTP cyclohydrolase I
MKLKKIALEPTKEEKLDVIAQAVKVIIDAIGEDSKRSGLLKTPERVAKALVEMTSGIDFDPTSVLGTIFEEGPYDEMIIEKGIPFSSLCEHHLLPFVGTATIAYIPRNNKIVGLSKLARLLEGYARRPQVQERLTTQIAEALHTHLKPLGVGVVIEAEHFCMSLRGVQRPAKTVTSCLLGAMKDDQRTRAEFLALAR